MPDLLQPSPAARAPAWFVLLAGLAVTALLATLLWKLQQREALEQVRGLAQDRVEVIRSQIMRSMEVLNAIAAFLDTKSGVTRSEFGAFVDGALERHPELQAVAWDPRVRRADRAAWEARAQAEGLSGFHFTEEQDKGVLVRAADRDEYFPVFYLESLAKNAPALGFDVLSEPRRRAALEMARDSNEPRATAPIRLAQEPESQLGIVVFEPVYDGPSATVEERRSSLRGFATAVFRIGDLVERSLRPLGRDSVAVTVKDQANGAVLYEQQADRVNGGPHYSADVNVAGQRWELVFDVTKTFKGAQSPAPWLAAVAGSIITILLTGHLRNNAQQSARLLAEVTVRKQAETAAEAANRAKSEFLANMSHEIRTPMNAILGYSQILAKDSALPPFHRDAVATILRSGDHLLHLINEILDLSKIDAGRMEVTEVDFDLNALLRELVAMFHQRCEEKQIGLKLEAPEKDRPFIVHGDEGKLRQVLINLLSNAVKFTHWGRITLRAVSKENNEWYFEVEDTGIGIPEPELSTIFEPFQLGSAGRSKGGTGLGLAISKRQADILGGKLGVRSMVGHGTCFSLLLHLKPALQQRRAIAPQHELVRLEPGQHVRALVVDDIPENREVLATMLTMTGCEVVLAEHGRQAIEVVRVSRPQIVFMDIRMPDFDGMTAARRIIAEFGSSGLKVVAMSASALAHEREQYLEAGCDDFVSKPFRTERLHQCLTHLLGVSFHRSTAADNPVEETIDLRQIILPEDLAARLAMAAELHSATVLKSCLAEMEKLGPAAARAASHLRGFLSCYDMKSIQQLVAQLHVTS